MKLRLISTVVAIAVVALVAGCDSMSSRMQERFAPASPKAQVVSAAEAAVFGAAQATLKQLDFQVSRTAQAQGIVNGFSRIHAGDSPRENRQLSIEIRLHAMGPAQTEVEVWLREQVEGGLAGSNGATDQPLREHGLYDVFFATLQKTLANPPAAPTKGKKP